MKLNLNDIRKPAIWGGTGFPEPKNRDDAARIVAVLYNQEGYEELVEKLKQEFGIVYPLKAKKEESEQ